MAMCCATQLVASTVVCSSEVAAKYWLITWAVDCVLDWLQQTEKGAVQNMEQKLPEF